MSTLGKKKELKFVDITLKFNHTLISLPAEANVDKAVTTATQAKPLVEVLSSQKLYSTSKLPPAPRFGPQVKWKVSEDFIPPNDGKICYFYSF